ncbi:uncharacterized protein LOC125593355 [Brassica napus]|uniref:uncharacterized protein LOC125593355 n=1 Tax=Brassica napus TaxID=3708 RepID=UPI00207AA2D6|nr:uncharacterized protein LOC125593355 [Brassica napus]
MLTLLLILKRKDKTNLNGGEAEKLESDVREMCKKITEYRQTTLPDHHLRNTALSSSSHTPNIDSRSDLQNASLSQQQDCGQRLIQLKETVSRNNAGNIPLLVKRVGECAEGIHKLDSLNTRRTIHPAFRKPRITP